MGGRYPASACCNHKNRRSSRRSAHASASSVVGGAETCAGRNRTSAGRVCVWERRRGASQRHQGPLGADVVAAGSKGCNLAIYGASWRPGCARRLGSQIITSATGSSTLIWRRRAATWRRRGRKCSRYAEHLNERGSEILSHSTVQQSLRTAVRDSRECP